MNNSIEKQFEYGPYIQLPGLGEQLKLPHNNWFRYAGEVPSLVENIYQTQLSIRQMQILPQDDSVFNKYSEQLFNWLTKRIAIAKIETETRDDLTSGTCTSFPINQSTTAHVIAIKSGMKESHKIFTQGHESGELLMKLKQQQQLQNFLDQEGISLDSSKFHGEDFADLGGLLALRKAVKRGLTGIIVPTPMYRPSQTKALASIFEL